MAYVAGQNESMLTTRLIDSVAAGNLNVAVECLQAGGEPNTLSVDGATAMHIAAGVGVEAVRLMLSFGGDPNVRSVDGSTPLHVAAAWGDKDTLRLLLHNGANPNIVDCEGQRAVDAARSEDHGDCVDFLKYYTMLMAVGDEDEAPVYTSEPIETAQGNLSSYQHIDYNSPPTDGHTQSDYPQAGFSSDEEDPINLSNEYSDALSRRLSRLLHDGNGACLDVTSPDCPYIGDKRDARRGEGDRTVLAESHVARLSDISDSDDDEDNPAVFEGKVSCRCNSNHCCAHDKSSHVISDVLRQNACCEPQYAYNSTSPKYCDCNSSYAKTVERKMKQKYFPDLSEGGQLSRRERLLTDVGSPENVCGRHNSSYFSPISPQRRKALDERNIRSVSPQQYQECMSPSRSKSTLHESDGNFHPSRPESLKSSPMSSCCQRRQRKQSSPEREHHRRYSPQSQSPRRGLYPRPEQFSSSENKSCSMLCKEHTLTHCHSPQRGLDCKTRTSPHRSETHFHQRFDQRNPCTSSCQLEMSYQNKANHLNHTSFDKKSTQQSPSFQNRSNQQSPTSFHNRSNQQNPCNSSHVCKSPCQGIAVPGSPPPSTLHRSTSDHSRQDHHRQRHGSGTSLKKQATYPPGETSHLSACGSTSPVTVMHVQGEKCSPSSLHRIPYFPFPYFRRDQEFTKDVRGGKETVVVGSCSGQSVDSGFCEKHSTRQPYNAHVFTPSIATQPRPGGWKNGSPMYNKTPTKLLRDEKHAETKFFADRSAKSSFQDKSCEMPFSKVHMSPLTDDANIVSSNLRGKNHKFSFPKSEKRRTACDDDGEMWIKKETPEDITDTSASSSDTFQTCEDASVHRPDSVPKPEGMSHWQDSFLRDRQQVNGMKSRDRNTEAENQGFPSLHSEDTVTDVMETESLGFSVSGVKKTHESQASTTNHTERKTLSETKYISPAKNRLDVKYPDVQSNKDSSPPSLPKDLSRAQNQQHITKSELGSKSLPSAARNQDHRKTELCSKFLPRVQNQQHLKKTELGSKSVHKSWVPPSGPLPDDSLMTSDDSFMIKPSQACKPQTTSVPKHISSWLQTSAPPSRSADIKNRVTRVKRTSDESILSIASSIQEYVYHDKEKGIALLERHIPSECSGSSSRLSVESGLSLEADDTQSYDWSDFVIGSEDGLSQSDSSSFDVTAGQTMNSQNTIKVDSSDGCDEDCSYHSEDLEHDENSDAEDEDDKKAFDNKPRVDKQHNKESKHGSQVKKKKNPPNSETSSQNSNKNSNTNSQQSTSEGTDSPLSSTTVTVTPDLASLSNEALSQRLKDLGEDPGPVVPSTRQSYLRLLASLQSGQPRLVLSSSLPGYSSELNRLVLGTLDLEDLPKAELAMVSQFQASDGRTWREGTIKSCFNYLLLDPRVTDNLPLRAKTLSDMEAFKTFLSAVFYIGKGKRSRPYCHLYEAISQQQSPKPKVSQKVQQILDIWAAGVGVVSLHCFQNVIPVEAYTREACMVDAIGLGRLTNVKKGDYYGVASTWPATRRRCMGAYLLRKAFQIFLSEGERQICPLDIKKGS